MNLWINIKRDSLLQLLKQIHVLLLNDEEARMLGGTSSLVKAAEAIRRRGVERLLIKKGEHGCLMFGPEGVFAAPALALPVVKDPTGAGDTFAGGMLGWIAGRPLTPDNWRKAILVGTAMASFCVEDFSVKRLRSVTPEAVNARTATLRAMMQVGKI
jgi:sugar/nucleoside kinase (ribokinase family)